jgi:lipoic acid synthetase
VIRKVKLLNPETTIETLIPDFDGKPENLKKIIEAGPDIISHNIETVRRLTPVIRTKAKYERSLGVLEFITRNRGIAKSGFMVGLGEEENEIEEAIDDLIKTGCRILTIGQYLKPSRGHMEPVKYVDPGRFEKYRKLALSRGFKFVESTPLVRSSFHAEKHVKAR